MFCVPTCLPFLSIRFLEQVFDLLIMKRVKTSGYGYMQNKVQKSHDEMMATKTKEENESETEEVIGGVQELTTCNMTWNPS